MTRPSLLLFFQTIAIFTQLLTFTESSSTLAKTFKFQVLPKKNLLKIAPVRVLRSKTHGITKKRITLNRTRKDRNRRNKTSSSPISSVTNGTRIRLGGRPTRESVWNDLFSAGCDLAWTQGNDIELFNHDCIGMTHPYSNDSDFGTTFRAGVDDNFLARQFSNDCSNVVESSPENNFFNPRSHSSSSYTKPNNNVHSNWWPDTKVLALNNLPEISNNINSECIEEVMHGKNKWKVMKYRRRVGMGKDCYTRVKNAALDWEFNIGTNSQDKGTASIKDAKPMGIIRASPPRNSGDIHPLSPLPDETNRHVMQIYSSPGGRRLVTYTQALRLPNLKLHFLRSFGIKSKHNSTFCQPGIYAMNSVGVVYDVIDNIGPKGTTFSSTAYATLRGHWLRGEERVTVVYRNPVAKESHVIDANLVNSGSITNRDIDKNGVVDVEILSISRSGPSFIGKIIW
eukprot:CAMPEP_0184854946 /NCGR_PEP_ID=MMETSP0580-20130426/308_1 /TAXON_ID=1118495 /ORGANISM="Dactyliosolen fragilissimus" /LENGTH=453 /DNA_ID=CAMNT_0027349327 /DNA_START=46 /DNA_END=1404 /DNA_ORIENTATION=-